MPRSNRPRGRKPLRDDADEVGNADFTQQRTGGRRVEVRRSGHWNVQSVSAVQAQKNYVCPGCTLEVPPGQAHVVAWRADGVLGDAVDVSNRRHWHTHCWKIT